MKLSRQERKTIEAAGLITHSIAKNKGLVSAPTGKGDKGNKIDLARVAKKLVERRAENMKKWQNEDEDKKSSS